MRNHLCDADCAMDVVETHLFDALGIKPLPIL